MDSLTPRVLPLTRITDRNIKQVGSKAARLASLLSQGYRVPRGFCITAAAYRDFLKSNGLDAVISCEIDRKPFSEMRWEEIWDSALRIRSSFLAAPIPEIIQQEIKVVFLNLGLSYPLAARSTGIREDSGKTSFAGLHDSFINIPNWNELLKSVRLVWASLWSDAALLYQKELRLNPASSEMAVLIQEMAPGKVSGVAFGIDPREKIARHEVVESVPGSCSLLVSGELDPDRWILKRKNGALVRWDQGRRSQKSKSPLLKKEDLSNLHLIMRRLQKQYRWEPDLEWTGNAKDFTLLQLRPVTAKVSKPGDKRGWYLTLRLSHEKLRRLRKRVANDLIPKLKRQGDLFSQERLEQYSIPELARSLRERYQALREWKKIYETDFIPFAHGVRAFGIYYNDLLKPSDPYKFVQLLEGETLLTMNRQEAMEGLAAMLKKNPKLALAIRKWNRSAAPEPPNRIKKIPKGNIFLARLKIFQSTHADVSYKGKRLSDSVGWILGEILVLQKTQTIHRSSLQRDSLEKAFLKKVGPKRKKEACEILETARISWRLRDDDNLLVARIESQFLRALDLASKILRQQGKLSGGQPSEEATEPVIQLLKGEKMDPLVIKKKKKKTVRVNDQDPVKPRQLTGNPAAPGIGTGRACLIHSGDDFEKFQKGDILVCDAIQPQITHLVPLAAGIIERRGGMLIHGAIIARELGVPCVNGIPDATEKIRQGDFLTVDGYLGIVSVGKPDFEIENRVN